MKYQRFVQLFLAVLSVFGVHAYAEPIVIALIDSPLDYSQPYLKMVIDRDLMRKLKFPSRDGNWYSDNQDARTNYQAVIDRRLLPNVVAYSNSASASSVGTYTRENRKTHRQTATRLLPLLDDAHFEKQLDLIDEYFHGTTVASVMVHSLQNITLINYVYDQSFIYQNDWKARYEKVDLETLRTEERAVYEEISVGLKQAKVRVLNYSRGTSYEDEKRDLFEGAPFWRRTLGRPFLIREARQNSKIIYEEFVSFVRNNPDTVFVVAAGNQGEELTKRSLNRSYLHEPNVVVVAAAGLREDGTVDLTDFSNFSSEVVSIAAPGVGIKTAKVGGGSIHTDGTSIATPLVVNRIASIIQENPALTAPEAIQSFYNRYAFEAPSLVGRVQRGRYLKVEFENLKLKFVKKSRNCDRLLTQ